MNHPTKNTAIASLQFDFRGQTFRPTIKVDMDALMQRQEDIHHLYDRLAASIGLDAYRHEYDVMVLETICFSEPSGLVGNFITDGCLDFDAFAEAWLQQQVLNTLQPIARKHLGIENLEHHPDLRNALIESYHAGHNANKRTPPCPNDRF